MELDWNSIAGLVSQNSKTPQTPEKMERYKALASTDDGKKVIQKVSGDAKLKKSAEAAMQGDMDAAKRLLMQLISSKEGAVLAQKVMEINKGK